MNVFVFDIETVPDVQTGRRILELHDLSDEAVAEAMMSQSKEASGQTFLKCHLQKIVAISLVYRSADNLKICSLGGEEADEAELIQRFFKGIQRYQPTLVSWNGAGFDLPVLHYRALYHGISAPIYWETGERDSTFKYNNYQNRYHTRHVDLMDTLAAFQPKAFGRLDDIAVLIGLPGKMGLSGSEVWETYLKGEIGRIRHYCEIDVLNTYLIFLRFELIRGNLSLENYHNEIKLTQEKLREYQQPHFEEFLKAWKDNNHE